MGMETEMVMAMVIFMPIIFKIGFYDRYGLGFVIAFIMEIGDDGMRYGHGGLLIDDYDEELEAV